MSQPTSHATVAVYRKEHTGVRVLIDQLDGGPDDACIAQARRVLSELLATYPDDLIARVIRRDEIVDIL